MSTREAKSYRIERPRQRTTGAVFASPHSGCDYPWAFLRASVLDERSIRSSEDAFVDELFADATAHGAPLIAAAAPRAYIDLNRSADELDPALIRGVATVTHNPRVSSGLGVIPRVVAGGRAIYRGKITLEEAKDRIAEVWRPYHRALQREIDEARAEFGRAILIDCHSMPHEAIDAAGSRKGRGAAARLPEIVLGDRFGAACGGEVMDLVEAAFAGAGFRVARNAPFAGAYVAQSYGRPARGQHAIQVEIDRSLYMNEETIERGPQFDEIRTRLGQVIGEIAAIGRGGAAMPLAAE
ncbi:N-formylglutamate amidohydrolase [Oceanicola sp. 502str15]|uniref:N-formylglutamate amidohydrolase n=1 Tax=Oceanicola sp. 502str15 TaxID=2696061 RepID=UPI0020946107|nr:N-formylglutamate amidohydrolase [Oceanicola sp. 502str15]MCO6383838.1 N-formylglutamate amidohydrolase [Oceanicola sp. 502str15]